MDGRCKTATATCFIALEARHSQLDVKGATISVSLIPGTTVANSDKLLLTLTGADQAPSARRRWKHRLHCIGYWDSW